MFKDNIWERLAADDMQSVYLLTSHLRRLLGGSTDGVMQWWIKECHLGYSLSDNKEVANATAV